MAKRKRSSKKAATGGTVTITVPDEWKKYDKEIIQGIIEATLGKGQKFGISKVIVQTEAQSTADTPPTWDKLC
jgi:hypothetical protein